MRDLCADDVGPRRQELAELDVGRAELGQRGGEPAGAVFRGAGRSISRAMRDDGAFRQRQRARIDQREHALARQNIAGARRAA